MTRDATMAGLAACLLLVAAPSLARASEPGAPPAAPPPAGAARTPSPFTFTGAYTVDLLDNLGGGQATGGRYIDLLKLSAAYEGGAAGLPGLTGQVSLEHSNGASLSGELVGAAQAVSSIEATPEAFRLYEAWIQKDIAGGAGDVRAGLTDLNTLFDVQETAALFLNASDGVGAELGDTGLNGPSDFPTPALAVTGAWRPARGWTARFGVFDGIAGDPADRGRFVAVQISPRDGALLIAQVERRWGEAARLEAGAWSYTSTFKALDRFGPGGAPRQIGGDGGLYGLIEGRLLTDPRPGRGGLAGWVRVGVANGDINPIADYLGAGVVYTGLISDRDQAGVAINRAGFGGPARAAAARGGVALGQAETTLEATFAYAANHWLRIQPDIQYVIDPGGVLARPNAVVVGARLVFTASR